MFNLCMVGAYSVFLKTISSNFTNKIKSNLYEKCKYLIKVNIPACLMLHLNPAALEILESHTTFYECSLFFCTYIMQYLAFICQNGLHIFLLPKNM